MSNPHVGKLYKLIFTIKISYFLKFIIITQYLAKNLCFIIKNTA